MGFIVPNKQNPKIMIESSYMLTTSSGQGDKSKTEINIKEKIKEYYPQAQFLGFIDGIGWYVRKKDFLRMVSVYEDVFTFHPDGLKRFEEFLKKVFQIN